MAINLYEPNKFRSQGIEDLATVQTLTITNDKISVKNVEAKEAVVLSASNFSEMDNKGIRWSDGRKSKSLLYKQDTLWTDLSLNLSEEKEFLINDTSVLSFSELGRTVTKSNLKTVGILKSLQVSGNTSLGDFVYVSSDLNKVGINTNSPKLAVGIRENNVEISIGSDKAEYAAIGTSSSSHLNIITDNTPRITVYSHGDVRVHGKLIVDDLVTERTPWMMFKETAEQANYGKGIVWAQLVGPNKQLVLHSNPDRLWTTENIDLAFEKTYMIEGMTVLSKTRLGNTVSESELTKVGVLQELQVAGDAAVARCLSVGQLEIGRFQLNENELKINDNISIVRNETVEFKIDDAITIGHHSNTDRTVSIYGSVAVGVAQPDANVALTVEGTVSFGRKKFQVGTVPTEGQYNKGDIVWNTDPKATDYIGWVCVTPGTPGAWLPFGAISSR